MTEQIDEVKKRERSPEYPGIDLEEALNKAKALYVAERRNAAPVASVLKHWGYAPRSGGGQRAIAALEKFGLIVAEGNGENRKARITEEAFRILIDERPDSEERMRLIQEAALRPTAHAELWEKYKFDLPSEPTLMYELRQRGFISTAAADFLREYRKTLKFAKLDNTATLTEEYGDTSITQTDPNQSREGDSDQRSRPRRQGMTVLSLQISDRLIELSVEGGPLTKSELSILRKYLELQEDVALS